MVVFLTKCKTQMPWTKRLTDLTTSSDRLREDIGNIYNKKVTYRIYQNSNKSMSKKENCPLEKWENDTGTLQKE